MNINFAPIDDGYIKSKIDEGFYTNATELVRDAVRRMREGDADFDARLFAALDLGERDISAGRTVRYTPSFMDEAEKRARENIAKGIKPNPDVCP